MPVRKIIVPDTVTFYGTRPYVLYGDGVRDDTVAMQALLDGERVVYEDGTLVVGGIIRNLHILVSKTLILGSDTTLDGNHIISTASPIINVVGERNILTGNTIMGAWKGHYGQSYIVSEPQISLSFSS